MSYYHVAVYFDVYGCQMNTNDAEIAWSVLKEKGYKRTADLTEVRFSTFSGKKDDFMCDKNVQLSDMNLFLLNMIVLNAYGY